MRIISAVLIWIVFIGGLTLFIYYRDAAVPSAAVVLEAKAAQGVYALEITTTFTLEPDPFAIQTDDEGRAPALLVRLGSHEILRKTDRLEAGSIVRVEPLTGLVLGDNEIYLQASPPIEEIGKNHAVRLQILLNNQKTIKATTYR